ncbi:hypothetical protein CRUP_001074 [Coryphaenoides rupestris]|nr:hypothetical protein CRUP_001074 [Coryphaenoides rupestris]
MDLLDFSEEEIQEQLAVLGYRNIPKHKLGEFKRDLDQLIQHEKLKIQDCSSELNTTSSSRSQQAGGLKTTTTTSSPQQVGGLKTTTTTSPQQVGGLKTTTTTSPQQAGGLTTTTSSPPAYTKEKVSLDSLRAGGRLFLHVGTAEHHRQVLSPSGLNRQPDTRDSYARHTVGPRPPQPPMATHRLHVLPDPGPPPPDPPAVDRLPQPTSQASSPEGDIRFIDSDLKPGCAGAVGSLEERGNLRPRAQDVSGLEQRLGGLRVSATSARRRGDDLDGDLDEDTENDDITRQSGDITSQSDAGSSDVIRPALSHPHTRNLKKTDPVARYFQYKQEWDMFKVPGEKDRRALHWEIRERLAYQPPPVRPRRVYAPNSYIVPTEKKRSALRWEVRNDLANGLLPPSHNYRF